jgi:transcriptional regulator with XRE-family HTH domain
MMTDQNEPYSSPLIDGLLDNITPAELQKTKVKMVLAARIDDILQQKGWTKKQFALKLSKSPSEITKWLSGTHNFTIDTLSDICHVLDMDISVLFRRTPEQTISTWIGITTSKNDPYDIKDPVPFHVQEKDAVYINTTNWHSETFITSQNN